MNLIALFHQHNIEYWESGKNVADGNINVCCPWCDDKSNHGGFTPDNRYICWRCGSHSAYKTIFKLTGQYHKFEKTNSIYTKPKGEVKNIEIVLPGINLQPMHKKYLCKRGFNPDELELMYGLKGTLTTPESIKYRIVIPIYDINKKLVGWQARTIGNQEPKYMNLKGQNIKHVLFAEYLLPDKKFVIVVEGPFDCMKLGIGAVSTLGAGYTQEQVLKLSNYENIFILFDNDSAGKEKAKKLNTELNILGCKAKTMELIGVNDPGEYSYNAGKNVIKNILNSNNLMG